MQLTQKETQDAIKGLTSGKMPKELAEKMVEAINHPNLNGTKATKSKNQVRDIRSTSYGQDYATRADLLEAKLELKEQLHNLDAKIPSLENKIVLMISEVERRLSTESKAQFRWLVGTVIAAVGVIIGVMKYLA
jgi:hypothetical protein